MLPNKTNMICLKDLSRVKLSSHYSFGFKHPITVFLNECDAIAVNVLSDIFFARLDPFTLDVKILL